MRKTLSVLALSFCMYTATAQSDSGLIAHWDMNGGVTDVSGNGHDGHPNNLIADTGIGGAAGTAYYFNGVNSSITVPYSPAFDLSQYSICAKLLVKGFYSGFCQVNTVLTHGPLGASGSYTLWFYDNPFDGDNCSLMDTTEDVFVAGAGNCNIYPNSSLQYSPTIVENKWYNVVATFDGTTFRIFVNGVLLSSHPFESGAFGSGSDSISIGMDIFDAPTGGPYNFKGLMDDVRLYNRALSDSEIQQYSDSCVTITIQPASINCYPSSDFPTNETFTVGASSSYASYQWQVNEGFGFVNISNTPPYSGANTDSLEIADITTSMNNYYYRCIVSSSAGCSDTSVAAELNTTLSVNTIAIDNHTKVFPSPARDMITVETPYTNGVGAITIFNEIGQIFYQGNIINKFSTINIHNYPAGAYIVKIYLDGQTVYRKVLKQ